MSKGPGGMLVDDLSLMHPRGLSRTASNKEGSVRSLPSSSPRELRSFAMLSCIKLLRTKEGLGPRCCWMSDNFNMC